MIALIISLCSGAIVYAVSVMYAGIGETFSERAGIMNLGVEGVMLMGAVSGYITAVHTQNLFLSFLVVLLTGAALGLAFAFLTVTLQSDQTVCGMAMLIFGTGLSGFIGKDVSGVAANLKFEKIAIPVLSKIPVLGDIFFKQNLLTMEEISEEDTSLIESTVEELVDEGADIIFGCSAGYSAILAELQQEYPDVIFAQQSNDVYDNIIEFQIRGYEGDFLTGYLSALMNEGSNQLGFCASMDEASVRTAINAYALGAKYANPDAKVQVLWADSWYDLDVESQNAKTLIDNGIKYMGMEASSPAVPQTCEENGAFCIGYNVDMQASAPKAVLTSFVWNWAPIFEDIMKKTADGTIDISANYYEGGECAALAPFNKDLVPQEIQDKVEALREKINNGDVQVYAGELKDDQGNVLVKDGEVMSDDDILAQDFFVDNVIGGKK